MVYLDCQSSTPATSVLKCSNCSNATSVTTVSDRLQEDIIANVLAGGDSLVIMPTGGGKSSVLPTSLLCALDGITLVVSPLIALMKDQVDGLKSNGIKAEFINSTLPYEEMVRIRGEALRGEIKILYVSPERLALGGFRSLAQQPERLPRSGRRGALHI